MVRKKKESQEPMTEMEPIAVESASYESDLLRNLEEIKDYEGVTGYILRNTASASIDLKDQSKLADYAILSSTVLELGEKISEIFSLGDMKNITINGKIGKMLSLTNQENRISVFTEQNADIDKILKKLQK